MTKKILSLTGLCLFLFAAAGLAKADEIYTLFASGGTTPYGTVNIHQVSATEVQVTETLVSGERFAAASAGGDILGFDLTGTGTFTISNINDTTDFAQDTSSSTGYVFPSQTSPGTKTGNPFTYAIECITCQGGSSTNPSGPVVFDVSDPSGISYLNFTPEGNGYYFAADIWNQSTFDIGANSFKTTPPVPEPSSLLLLGTGLAALAGTMKLKLFGRV